MDSLQSAATQTGGIPDVGARIIAIVAMLFVLSIMAMLLWARARELDEGANS